MLDQANKRAIRAWWSDIPTGLSGTHPGTKMLFIDPLGPETGPGTQVPRGLVFFPPKYQLHTLCFPSIRFFLDR